MSMAACKKDAADIPKDNDKNIRVLKVQYLGHNYSSDFVFDPPFPMYTRECTYYYDSEGRLSYIKNDDILRAQVDYNQGQIIVTNEVEQDSRYASYWDRSDISIQNNRVEKVIINTFSPGLFAFEADKLIRKVNIGISSDGRLKSVILDSKDHNGGGIFGEFFGPLNTEILSYDNNGLPEKLDGFLVLVTSPSISYPQSWDFAFQYKKADEIPTKLKRLVNEELLFSNRYGVTNYDIFYTDSSRNYSQFGEGNWLVSFGLPQYYILEEKSSHLVSQRTTNYYQLNSLSGNREFIKTKVEDFPYVHDATAKTLEIAALKIWYEFVE